MGDGQVQGRLVESNQMSLAYEANVFDKREGEGGRMGCTLVTGFLGSGKTTLVHHILHERGDLRIAVLVNEFADIDIDSLLLDSSSMNAALGLPALSLANGCACCTISGNMQDAVRAVLSSKHNFDYLVIETSGIADPHKISEDLQVTGVNLDMIVTVVDAEALDVILELPVARKQLAVADVVLINKCDLASLNTIANAEDRIEEVTGGTKAVRCRFCKVPLSLVMNVVQAEAVAPLAATMANSVTGFLSHEAITFPLPATRSAASVSRSEGLHEHKDKVLEKSDGRHAGLAECVFFSSTFSSKAPIALAQFQNVVVSQMQAMKGLLRAKGVIWFSDIRDTRFLFHWSGKKRVEAVYGGRWESQGHNSLVLIGRDKVEIEQLVQSLNKLGGTSVDEGDGAMRYLREVMGSDKRFKVDEERSGRGSVAFGLVGSPLRGVQEADLNAALMRSLNGNGVLFVAAVSSRREGHVLQLSLDGGIGVDVAWKEVCRAATGVIAKGMKDVCPCRCEMRMHK